jgi:hypothetical protein
MSLLHLYNLVERHPQPASCAREVSEYYFLQSTCTSYTTFVLWQPVQIFYISVQKNLETTDLYFKFNHVNWLAN